MNNEEECSPTEADKAPLMIDGNLTPLTVPTGGEDSPSKNHSGSMVNTLIAKITGGNEFYLQALKFTFCFAGLQVSYLTCKYCMVLRQCSACLDDHE